MESLRRLLADLPSRFISAITGREGRSRQIIIAALSAICLLALAGTALLFAAQGDPLASGNAARSSTATRFAATLTPTDAPTATAHPTTPSGGGKKVSGKPVNVPKPPPPPPKPPAPPTATPCATATSVPTATATATATPTATATTSSGSSGAVSLAAFRASSCTPCGVNAGNNPSQSQIRAALDAAANLYGLPHNLLYGFAWQES